MPQDQTTTTSNTSLTATPSSYDYLILGVNNPDNPTNRGYLGLYTADSASDAVKQLLCMEDYVLVHQRDPAAYAQFDVYELTSLTIIDRQLLDT